MSIVGQEYELMVEGGDGFTDYKFRVVGQRGVWLNVVLYEIHRRPDEGEEVIEHPGDMLRARVAKSLDTDGAKYHMIRLIMEDKNARWYAYRYEQSPIITTSL
jgi:hypothetical protein